MRFLKRVLIFGFFLALPSGSAQQTGSVVATKPSATARSGIAVRAVTPKPRCETSAQDSGGEIPALPEMVFSRQYDELTCVRHVDGRTEELDASVPNGVFSADGKAIAHWNQQAQELRVYLISSRSDVLVDSLPGAKLRSLEWSRKGSLLSYFLTPANPAGIRWFNIDTGQRGVFPGSFIGAVGSADPGHAAAVGLDGVEEISVAAGTRENVAKVKEAVAAQYSANGKYLGILGNQSVADLNAPPATASADGADNDEPDCRGASFALILQDAKTRQLRDVPYPEGFDTVLDFSFSPDESAIAVTFGVVGCDYPGDRARIFAVSLPDLKLTPITPEDRLSVKPVWTPNGKAIVYSDYTGSDSPLVMLDIVTGKAMRLTNPGQFGPDTWRGWR